MLAVEALLTPGKCAAVFIEPPCDPFKVLRHDLNKWGEAQVRPEQLRGRTLSNWKHGLLGAFGGRVFLAVRASSIESAPPLASRGLPDVFLSIALQKLHDLAALVELDVELHLVTADVPVVPRRKRTCTGEEMIFTTSSHPGYCDLSLPSGTRPPVQPMQDSIPFEDKVNRAFWRGSAWPARRCGKWTKSPRVRMVRAASVPGSIVNASFSNQDCGRKEPREMCQWLRTQKPHRVPPEEQLRYRFLPTSSPECTYTGRLQSFLMTNSVVAKFSEGAELAAQPLYGGLQDGVHLLLLRASSWEQQLRAAAGAWRSLEQMPRNAQAYTRWALSREAQACYLYELLAGYAMKLVYVPSESGNLAGMLRQERVNLSRNAATAGTILERTTAEKLTFKGETYHLYTAPVVSKRLGSTEAEAAMRAQCHELKARRPAEQVFSSRERKWVTRP